MQIRVEVVSAIPLESIEQRRTEALSAELVGVVVDVLVVLEGSQQAVHVLTLAEGAAGENSLRVQLTDGRSIGKVDLQI